MRSCVVIGLLFLVHCSSIRAEIIDFEQFDVGDGLNEINSVYAPQGITFVTEGNSGEIQLIGGSKVFAAFTPDANQLDILINFNFKIDHISADLLENGGNPNTGSIMEGYDRPKLPTSGIDGFQFQEFGQASVTLSWNHPGPFDSLVQTLHFGQDLGSNDFVTIDNIQYSRVIPEPSAGVFILLAAIAMVRRRRQ